jgi:hypothetical protein
MIRGRSQESRRRVGLSGEELPASGRNKQDEPASFESINPRNQPPSPRHVGVVLSAEVLV